MFFDITNNLVRDHLQDIEVNSFAKRSALPDHDDVTFLYVEGGGNVNWDVPVSLLISVVFGYIVQIISSHHNGSLHLCGNYYSLQDLSPD